MLDRKSNFYIDAVIQFYSSLNIETALHRCFCNIKNFMPVDRIFLGYYDQELEAIINFVSATAEDGTLKERQCPIPVDGQLTFKKISYLFSI